MAVFPFIDRQSQMALAKADLVIAREYTSLVKDKTAGERIFNIIEEEFRLTRSQVLWMTGQKELLDRVPVNQESIRLRNPYVDPLSFIQVYLLAERRKQSETENSEDRVLEEVLLTINGIAAGMGPRVNNRRDKPEKVHGAQL